MKIDVLASPELTGEWAYKLNQILKGGLTRAQFMAQIRETRLRLATARNGERPAEIARRTGSAWSADEMAAVNGLAAGASLAAGQLIKVAVREPYRARR